MQEKPTKAEAIKIRRSFQILTAAAVFMLTLGTVVMHFVEKLTWVDSLYFSVVSLTTVGYGDLTPTTDGGKLFVSFYLLTGIGIIAAFASTLLRNAVARRVIKKEK